MGNNLQQKWADHREVWRRYKKLYKLIFYGKDRTAWHHQAPGCMHIRIAVRATLRALPLVTLHSPAESYFIHTSLSTVVLVAASPRTWPRVHSHRCACLCTCVPSCCSTQPC